jgi:protein-tyrosine phosphatase
MAVTIVNPVPPLNFRDVGGLPTIDGSATRPHVLFRSDALYAGDDLEPLAGDWPPATVIDLRRPDEGTEFDLRWPATTAVRHLSFLDPAFLDPTMTTSSRSLAELYLNLLTAGAATVAGTVAIAANTSGPVLVHCAAGKDRTGIVVAVLLLAAGVTRDAVVADYLVTGSTARRRRERVAAFGLEIGHAAVPDEFFDVSQDAIDAVLDVVAGAPERPAARWLVEHGAAEADLAAWTRRLVGEPQLVGERR